MSVQDPKQPQNSREFLPPTQDVKFVPMSEEQFNRGRNRKILIWAGSILAGALVLSLIVWQSSAPTSVRNTYDDALRLYNAGKYPDAATLLNQAISEKPSMIEAYQLRGNSYRVMNQPENAVPDLTRVIEAHPGVPENYRGRAQCYHDLGKFAESIKDYTKLIELQPSADAYNGRGICYRDLGQVPRAIEDFSKAVELAPNVDNILQRGMAFASLGDHTKAIADYDRAIDLRPDVPYPYRARAYAREALGDRSGADADRAKARMIEYPAGKPVEKAKS